MQESQEVVSLLLSGISIRRIGVMTKPKSKKQALIGNFFKRKYEEINDDDTIPNETTPPNVDVDSSPNVDNDNIQANDAVNASPNVDQANDDVDASPNVDNDNPTTSIPTTRGIIASYHPNQIDDIRRSYLVKGAFQPRSHKFPVKDFYGKKDVLLLVGLMIIVG
ncbi:hypothetical protein HanPSC8_Chr01g0022471 [Helianthus annuus]|nr:hypothetical protein HanPSC8_Chr01g0022471 [Helianthus annuus]